MKIEQLLNTELMPAGTIQNGICIPYGTIPLWFLNDDLKEVTVDGELVKLTPLEYNILLLQLYKIIRFGDFRIFFYTHFFPEGIGQKYQ